MRGHVLWGLLLLLGVDAISYRCDNNQVLIVQNFGNDTIRMHCQRLNICGFDNLDCEYEHQQHTCGGKYNFVAHVNQQTATGPVEHTCCLLKQKEEHLSYDNDCFVYELPDGSHSDEAKTNGTSKSDDGITVLKNANQIPEQFDGYVGYRMRLFMLRNKSPPTLIVKAIERVPAGYRVTICRPRCGKFANEGVGEQVTVTKEQETKIPEGDEWAAAAWSSWQTSTWSTWSKTTWSAWEEASAENSAGVRSRAHRLGHDSKGTGPLATAISSAKAENGQDAKSGSSGNGGATPIINNNVHVHAEGGKGGEGGQAHIQLPDEKQPKDNEKSAAGDLSGGRGDGRLGPAHSDSDLAGDGWNFIPDEKNHGQRKNKKLKNAKKAKWDEEEEEEEEEDETADSDEEREESAEKKGKKLIGGKGKDGKSKNGDNDTDKGDKEDPGKDAVDGGTDEDGGVRKDQSKALKSNADGGNADKTGKTGKKGKGKPGKGPAKGDDEDGTTDADQKNGPNDDNGDAEGKPKNKIGKGKGNKGNSPSKQAKKGKKDKEGGDKDGLRGSGKDKADSDDNSADKNGQNTPDDKDRNGKKKANDGASPDDARKKGKGKGKQNHKGKDDSDKEGNGEDVRNDGDKYEGENQKDNAGKGKGGKGDNDEKAKNGGKRRNQGKKNNSGDEKPKNKDGKKDEDANKNKTSSDSGKDNDKNPDKTDKSSLGNGGKKGSKTVDGGKKKASGDAEKDGKKKPNSENNGQHKSGKENEKIKGNGNDVAKDGETEKKSPKLLRRKNGRLSTHDEGETLPEDGDDNGDDSENIKWASSEKVDKASKEGDENNNKSGETEGDNGDAGSGKGRKDKGQKSGGDSEEAGDGEGKKDREGKADGGNGDGKADSGKEGDGNKGGKADGHNNEEANALKNKESEEDDRTDEKSLANAGKRNRGTIHDAGDSDGTNEIGDDGGFKQGGDENDKQGPDADAKSGETEESAEGTNGNGKKSGGNESKFSGIINEKEPTDSDESVERSSSEKVENTTNGEEKETTSEGGFVVEVNAGVGTKSEEDSQEEGDKKDGDHKGEGAHEIGDHSGEEEHHGEGGHGGEEVLPWCDELKTKAVSAESSGESVHEASGEETLGTGFTGIISESSGEDVHSASGEEAHSASGEEIAVTTTQKCRNRPAKATESGPGHQKAHGQRSHSKPVSHGHGQVHSPPRPAPNAPPRDPNVLQWQDSPGPDSFLASMRSCFSGDTMVRTISGDKKMEDLQVGDYVLVPSTDSSMKYERVELFYHREPETYVKFVQLNTESGKSLSLTQLHLLPFGDCEEMEESIGKGEGTEEWIRKSKFSYKAQKGECLLTLDSEGRVFADKISKVGRRLSKGIYSPVTVEGAIVANDILASCFSQLESHSAQKMAFDLLIRVYHTFGYLKGAAHNAVQEVPIMLDYVHQLSWYILPFAKY
ncbi:unnamed protein product [Bursaphelenchus xylophilus]|uniref:(pine wood nematode) hypothetical protein n=1 Tax=Bursaphelenchus xylophilus TaxID=6326 RepID=A0A1I7SW96_BURXY|nr:unnamed protein product [Bursaphelenchus xylophilus]CAG9099052.1 unnamed protein product [Bursaphelenchus xylophilus]